MNVFTIDRRLILAEAKDLKAMGADQDRTLRHCLDLFWTECPLDRAEIESLVRHVFNKIGGTKDVSNESTRL